MDVSANVETDLESVSLGDKNDENNKISKTICLDDDVEESKNVFDESFESINNGDISDTDKSHGKNITHESVSTSKDVISLDSIDVSDKVVDEPVDNIAEIEESKNMGPSLNNDPEDLLNPSFDDENLLDEIHSGDFNATSSPVSRSSQLNNSEQTIDDSYEVSEMENHKIEEQEEEQDEEDYEEIEHEQEEQEERIKHNRQIDQSMNEDADDGCIVLDDDDDDDDDDNEDDEEDDDDDDDTDNEEESDDGSDKEDENDKVDISVSSDESEDGDVVKVPVKPKSTPSAKKKKMVYDYRRKAIKSSIKILTRKSKRTVATTRVTEQPNESNTCQSVPCENDISTDKTKEVDNMVQISKRIESEDDGDDVYVIDDSPVKVNGKHENIKIERMEVDDRIENDKIEEVEKNIVSIDHVPEVISSEEVHTNGKQDDLSSDKSNPLLEKNIINVSEVVPHATESNSEETVPKTQNETEKIDAIVNITKPNYKRSRSATPVDDVQPTKRLKTELEQSFIGHNKRVQEYIDKTSNNSIDEINKHVEGLLAEVQELHAMAIAKEQEWNNILYLKNVKEEIVYRLTRRKAVMEISSTKVGEVEDYSNSEQQPSLNETIKDHQNPLQMNNSSHNSNRNSYERMSTNEAVKAIVTNIAAMKPSDLAKERVITSEIQRLPKPELSGRLSPNINYMTSSSNSQHIQQQQKVQQQLMEQHHQQIRQQTELLNGHHQTQVGRQGAIKDVKSIIEEFHQNNPQRAPRRGRRLKGDGAGTSPRPSYRDGILARQSLESRVSELGLLLAKDGSSRPSSADSSPGNSNLATMNNNISTASSNISFNDVLMQYAKMSERPSEMLTSTSMIRQQSGGYPEVTLHPVNSQPNTTLHQSDSLQSNSLLHGILTKNTRPSTTYNSFSPTLARLLTAPERITTLPNNYRLPSSTPIQPKSTGINLTKPRNEITITPVMSNPTIHQTILQQQLQRQHDAAARMKFPMMDDEADDSADRLVIDEGEIHNEQNAAIGGREFPENEFPECQGCKKREAQFVCAGCGNQWYCSRSCQVSAWDEHCEVCSG